MTGITVDGRNFDVRIKYNTLERSFSLLEGNAGGVVLTGRKQRDILGTEYDYQFAVEPNPANMADYDELYEVLSEPTATHDVVMPYGQSEIEFEAMIKSGRDTLKGKFGSENRWCGLVVNYSAVEPQRR